MGIITIFIIKLPKYPFRDSVFGPQLCVEDETFEIALLLKILKWLNIKKTKKRKKIN
jgi:hypothetical protein